MRYAELNESQRKKGGRRTAMLLLAALFLGIFSESGFFSYAIGGKEPEKDKTEEIMLIPGGTPFGVRFYTEGALVYRLEEGSPAEKAGLKAGDLIVKVNGQELPNAGKLLLLLETSGDAADLEVQRKGRTLSFRVPLHEESGRMLGVHVRDSVAGIGTITYYDGEKGVFAGLGHGICDIDTGELMPLKKGTAMKVEIGGVIKGKSGKPGEIKGYFLPEKCGSVFSNTVCGGFGIFTELPSKISEPMSLGLRDEVKEGKADKEDNVLVNAPHPEYEVVANNWEHSYTREKAAYPIESVRENKFWINVARVDNTLGDRKLLPTCYGCFG